MGRPFEADYVTRTRALPVNLLFLMPWILIYQIALMGARSQVDNAAAAWLRAGARALGPRGFVVASLVCCLLLCLVVLIRLREAARDRGVFGGMFLEALIYGAVLGVIAQLLAHHLPLDRPVAILAVPLQAVQDSALAPQGSEHLRGGLQQLGLAVGAGIFEEIAFRGLLLGGLMFLLVRGVGMDKWTAAFVALPLSAYLFSDYHHWGMGGEPYSQAVFAYRFHAGLVLGVIYLTRGLGIAALAHAFYDILVLVR